MRNGGLLRNGYTGSSTHAYASMEKTATHFGTNISNLSFSFRSVLVDDSSKIVSSVVENAISS